MKTKRIINKKDVMKELLATMFESACTQKSCLKCS